jgi:SAM-dependent methyltransferase
MTVKPARPHYGYYSLYIFAAIASALAGAGIVLIIFAWQPLGLLVLGFGLYFALSYLLSIRLFRETEALDPPPLLALRGDETALDVGCGLGKLTVGVAKHLPHGKIIGIDIWSKAEIPGNCPERAYMNAEIEGVKDTIEFKAGNVLSIPFPDNSFDVVTASSVINNLRGDADKISAFKEVFRVLRPGGRFLLLEPLRNGFGFLTFTILGVWMLLPKDKWISLLKQSGFVNLKYDYSNHIGAFLVQKPTSARTGDYS